MKILTIINNDYESFDHSSLEVFSFLEQLTNDSNVTILAFGGPKEIISRLPANHIFYNDLKNNEHNYNDIAETINLFIREENPDFLLFQKDDYGNFIAPMLAFRNKFPYIPDVKKVVSQTREEIKLIRPIHGESAEALYNVQKKSTVVIKIRKNSFEEIDLKRETRSINNISLSKSNKTNYNIVETNKMTPEGLQLGDADIVVSGGRGMGNKDNFDKITNLAELFNGAVGASKAAVESGWIPPGNLVGLTGKSISPQLYLTFGISGASQHLAGCLNSQNIICVNTDESAPIFKYAKFGVIADCNDFLEELIEELKKIK